MKQENGQNAVNSTPNNNMLAGSPGIKIAPVSNQPVDASSADRGSVFATSNTNNSTNTNTNPNTNSNTVSSTVSSTVTSSEMPTVIQSPAGTVPTPPVTTTSVVNNVSKKKKSKAGVFIFLLLLIIGGLGYYIYTDYMKDQARGECSPLVASNNELRELDINSSIVKELYSKVKTSIREDIAYHNFDDTLKLYLAFRQIPNSEIYDSNCNLFNDTTMTNFTCSSAVNFVPKAFKVETLQREVKKLFGENVEIANKDITLGNSCYGGYQYIADRGEYVQGYCGQIPTTTYSVDKELVSATVQGDTITLKEKVRYYSAQGIDNPELKNGVYVYTFKLDNNYHYAYVNRTIEGA